MSNGGRGGGAESILAIVLGLIGAAAAIAIISALTSPPCPICKRPVARGANPCPHCHSWLEW